MELPRITDLAARQAIDSMRLFREFVRVRRELDAFEGSLFFKKIGTYEYLLHKVRGEVIYKGKRSTATETEYAEFKVKKSRLKARLETLKLTVETHQRMNKAVHAGAVPTEVIEVLTQLEQQGLAEKCVILGWPALYAYSQSSGIKLASVQLTDQKKKLVTSHPNTLRILVKSPDGGMADLLGQLKSSLRTIAEVEAHAARHSPWWDLKLHFTPAKPKSSSKTKASAKAGKHPETKLTKGKPRTLMLAVDEAAESQHAMRADTWVKLLEHTPVYEQVVIGKSGRMAVMRTLDPEVFVRVEHASQIHGGRCMDSEQTAQQIQLVEELLKSSMVITKLDDSAKVALNSEVLALIAAEDSTYDIQASTV